MMENLLARGEQIAAEAVARQVQRTAQQLRALFGSSAVAVDAAEVLVSGRGILKRWLVDPALRFLSGVLK